MPSSGVVKRLFANYKRVEKIFFRADKNGEKENYIKLKYQFRMMLTFSLLTSLLSLVILVVKQEFLPGPYPILASILIGFRFKWYNLPKIILWALATWIPIKYMSSDLFFTVPTAIMFTNIQLMVLTQSRFFTYLELIIQTLVFYFYGIEKMTQQIQGMTAEEIGKLVRDTIFFCIVLIWINLIGMNRFYAHVNNLLRKIGALRDNLTKVNDQLNDQNHKLQNNLEMKDVFIYTFSHELKNALNGLLGNLYLAYGMTKDSELVQLLSSAKVCGEVLKNFIHNILDSGKLENGNLEVAPERTDVMNFLENVWTICGRIIENKRLQGCLKIAKNVPKYLKLDEQRMIQIILNLVSNACKFTEKGHVRIHVSWQPTSPSDASQQLHTLQEIQASQTMSNNQTSLDQVIEREAEFDRDIREFLYTSEACSFNKEKLHLMTDRPKKFIADSQFYQLSLSKWHWNCEEVLSPSKLEKETKGVLKVQVIDTGCGMTPEEQSRLFRRFSQTSIIPGQRKVGTGLGLWICKELANGLDGDIKVCSDVGIGSTFELSIRTAVAPLIEKTSSQATLSICSDRSLTKPARRTRRPNTKKILIADDDSFNVELMKHFLAKFGINYFCAYDGQEAVALFKKHYEEICFVITDNFMPKKTGTEAALEISAFLKELKKPHIPIMCISGDTKVNIGGTGISSLIQKPINFDRLREEIMIIYPQVNNKFDL